MRKLWLLLGVTAIAACSSGNQLPVSAKILISPDSVSYQVQEINGENGGCLFTPDYFQDVPISLSVVDGLGRSLSDAFLTVYVDYSGNSFSGLEALKLYYDDNGNGVIDVDEELVSGVGDSAFRKRTGRYGKPVNLMLRVNLSCGFRANLYAFSENVAATSQIEVVSSLSVK